MMLVVVTLGEFQSKRKASQHLTLKNNCEAFFVTYLSIVPQTWRCSLGAESGCLSYNVEVFKKCLEMCEIGAESRWMLGNVSEMVGAFGKETLT